MVTRVISQVPINFPTKPVVPVAPPLTYPSDIFAPVGSDGMSNQFYTTIRYRPFNTRFNADTGTGTITLPIPRKINDILTLSWSQESFTSIFAALAGPANFFSGFAGTGLLVNPALFMMFKNPNFKVIEMSWTLVADNEQESIQIAKIIDEIKYQASPSTKNIPNAAIAAGAALGAAGGAITTIGGVAGLAASTAAGTALGAGAGGAAAAAAASQAAAAAIGGATGTILAGTGIGAVAGASLAAFGLMQYPSIFDLQLYPSKYFTFPMKPCIIEGIAADYTAGDVPAFHKNGSPVVVNLTIRFKEIEIWEKGTWPSDSPRSSLPNG